MNHNIMEVIKVIDSLINRSKNIHIKFKEGTSQFSLVRNRIKALEIAKDLLSNTIYDLSNEDYNLTVRVLKSTKSKCEKVLLKLQPHSTQYLHTIKIIETIGIVLDRLAEIKLPIILVKPTIEYRNAIMNYRQAFLDRKENLHGCSSLDKFTTVVAWLNHLNMMENPDTTPSGYVCSSTYLAIRINDNKIVGMISFRHSIDHPILSVYGGHIGYSILPEERRKGYGKAMLKLMLKICKEKGLDKVLITCTKENIASKKTILANGGLFDKEVEVDGNIYERYWIYL